MAAADVPSPPPDELDRLGLPLPLAPAEQIDLSDLPAGQQAMPADAWAPAAPAVPPTDPADDPAPTDP